VAWPLQPLDAVQAGVQDAPPYPLAQLLHREPVKPAEHVQLQDGRYPETIEAWPPQSAVLVQTGVQDVPP
jgi:hypothetical protein